MSKNWKYECHTSRSGDLEHGYPEDWAWAKNKGGYKAERDFFAVHWEVHIPEHANAIRLHVEAPRFTDDAFLNDLKREIVAALLASNVEQVVLETGYEYKIGVRTSDPQVRQNKCTEVFRVVMNDGQRKATHREDIEAVHTAVGPAVNAVLQRYSDKLNRHFT